MKKILCAMLWIQAVYAHAQQQLTSFKDNVSGSSYPASFIVNGNDMFFAADDGHTGRELWKTDGTEQGTVLVKDIRLGFGASYPNSMLIFKGKVYFIANDQISGQQIWVTDGTSSGTTQVSNLIGDGTMFNITTDGNFIYLLYKLGNTLELWKSNGSTSGTTLVKGGIAIWNSPSNFSVVGGLVYFTCQPFGFNETRVWRSNGTEDGTFPVTDKLDGDGSDPGGTSHPTQFTDYNGNLYFIARGTFTYPIGVGLMKSDGTVAGTTPIVAFLGTNSLISFGESFTHNGKMYFTFFETNSNHFFIMESDGTAANTIKIVDQYASNYFSPSKVLVDGDYFYFTVGNPAGGTSLAKFNVKTRSTIVLGETSNAIPRPFIFVQDVDVNNIVKVGSNIFVQSQTANWGTSKIMVGDGINATMTALATSQTMYSIKAFKDRVYFDGQSDVGFELLASNGTPTGTGVIKDINARETSYYSAALASTGKKVVFRGIDAEHGYETWVSDGTPEGTHLLRDFTPGKNGSFPFYFLGLKDMVVFDSPDTNGKQQMYSTDGTDAGTKAFTAFTDSRFIYLLKPSTDPGKFYFETYNPNQTYSLFISDGTSSGTKEIMNFGQNIYGVGLRISHMVNAGSQTFFILNADGADLWKTDGTPSGTVKIADLREVIELAAVGNNVYFTVIPNYDIISDMELYKSDGTPEGTTIVKNFDGAESVEPRGLTALGNKLVFTAMEKNSGREIWISDGTESGTTLLKDIFPGAYSSVYQTEFKVFGSQVYFSANDGTHGLELWRSDGTAANTVVAKDINPGPASSGPNALTVLDETMYFSAYDSDHGYEIWSTTGSDESIKMLVDVLPGPQYSSPTSFAKIGDVLLFVADTQVNGQQVWSYGNTVTAVEEGFSAFDIYPNPSTGLYQIELHDNIPGDVRIEILNLQGRRVYLQNGRSVEGGIDLRDTPAGIYVVKVMTKGKDYVKKVVKL